MHTIDYAHAREKRTHAHNNSARLREQADGCLLFLSATYERPYNIVRAKRISRLPDRGKR